MREIYYIVREKYTYTEFMFNTAHCASALPQAASFTETIKASAPFFTVIFAKWILGEQTSREVNLALMPARPEHNSRPALCVAHS